MKAIIEDLISIQDHVFVDSEKTAKQWTTCECDDYQLPLGTIIGFLVDATFPLYQEEIRLGEKPGHKVIVDLVRNSSLRAILVFDEPKKSVRYRDTVPSTVKEAIATFLASRINGIAN
jgi:hypothetical protein